MNSKSNVDAEPFLRNMATINLWFTKTSRWQTYMFFLLAAYNIFGAAANFTDYFVSNRDYLCAVPANISQEQAIPLVNDGSGQLIYDNCRVYRDFDKSTNETIPCPIGYNHSIDHKSHSLIAAFDLYCSRETLSSVPLAAYLSGIFIGSVICGITGDKYKDAFMYNFQMLVGGDKVSFLFY
ncbi:hypothetical protein ACOME3_001928 [Neoechinorhynchus agilis]